MSVGLRSPILVAVLLTLVPALSTCGGESSTTDPGGGGGGGGGGPSAPAAPSGLAAAPASGTAIDLTWQDNSTDETGFRVERSPDGVGSWSAVSTTGANATTYRDTGLTEGARRFYRIAAVGAGGSSGFSNVAEATTPSGTRAVVTEIEGIITAALPAPGTPLIQRNLLAEVQAVAAAAAEVPGVDTVIVFAKQATAQIVFDDGIVHLFINNRPDGVESLPGASPAPVPVAFPPRPSASGLSAGPAATDGPPGSPKAVVISYDGGAAEASQVAGLLSEAGYEIQGLGASLADMRNYKDLGVLHLDTHGVAYASVMQKPDGSFNLDGTSFALQTSTEIGTDLTSLRPELIDGSLAVTTVTDAAGRLRTRIGITERFIARHWTFDDGVVMLHSCFGGAQPFADDELTGGVTVDPSILRLTMLGAGARVVVAFDNLTWTSYALPTILHFFDRLLGADSYEPASPPLRPFDVEEVYADAQRRGLLQFTRPSLDVLGLGFFGNDVNVVYDRVPGRTTLAPSIRSMDVVDDIAVGVGQLTLDGLFGDTQGRVEVEGVAVAVDSWSESRIVAQVPFQGAGSAGPVVVKSPTGVEGNEAPLTEWRGTVTIESKVKNALTATATLDVRFRGDVHRFRESLDAEPRHRVVPTYLSPASSGTVRGSGSLTEGTVTTTWFGQEDMQILPRGNIDNGIFPLTASVLGGSVRQDPDAGTAEVCLAAWGIVQMRTQSPQGTQTTAGPVVLLHPQLVDRMKGLLGCFDASLDDDDFVIDGDTRAHSDSNAAYTLTWSDFTPFSPPTDQTAG